MITNFSAIARSATRNNVMSLKEKVHAEAASKKDTFRTEELFQGKREIVILHGDAAYRLQITKSGKLILNK
jgi:hemin uptake protein HemP